MKTYKNIAYDMSKVELKMMHGGHCHYIIEQDEDGKYGLAKLIYDYITSREENK